MKIRVINSPHLSPDDLTAVMDLLQMAEDPLRFVSPGYRPNRPPDEMEGLRDASFLTDSHLERGPRRMALKLSLNQDAAAFETQAESDGNTLGRPDTLGRKPQKFPESPVRLLSEGFDQDVNNRFYLAFEVLTGLLHDMLFFAEQESTYQHSIEKYCLAALMPDRKNIMTLMDEGVLCGNCRELAQGKKKIAEHIDSVLDRIEQVRKAFRSSIEISENPNPLPLLIKGHMKDLFIRDLGNLRFQFTPLEKTLYLLFLNYPEGIKLTHLADHYEEMRSTYKEIGNPRTMEELDSRIRDLADPFSNSASEKISRIKQKLEKYMGASMAAYYIIAGERAEPKKIVLDRALLIYKD